MIEFVKELSPRQVLIRYYNDYYLVSESKPDSFVPLETLVFACDEDGEVSDWIEIDGEIGIGIKDFLPKLLKKGKLANA